MDLVTLVTLCSVAFGPRLMHALIIAESDAKPWSFRERDAERRSFPGPAEAIAGAELAGRASLRVGLTGLSVDLGSATAQPIAALFEPCPNVALASFRLERQVETCRVRYPLELTERCALATYNRSFDAPAWAYADDVLLASAREDLPNPVISGACEVASPAAGTPRQADPKSQTIFVPLSRARR